MEFPTLQSLLIHFQEEKVLNLRSMQALRWEGALWWQRKQRPWEQKPEPGRPY